MPPQSRAQRRRQAARQQQSRPKAPSAVSAEAARSAASMGETIPLDAPTIALESAPAAGPKASAPPTRSARRMSSRAVPEPIDYSKDYGAVRRDLRWIALWTVLLFVAMIALRFSGLV
jgi:hypothetical protein